MGPLCCLTLIVILGLPVTGEARPRNVKTEAKQHFKRGKAAFELGRFKEALAEYEQSYELLPLPGFLFNIGQCYRNLDQPEKAIFFFRLYLRKKPKATNRQAVELLLQELESKLARSKPAPPTPQKRLPTTAPAKTKTSTSGMPSKVPPYTPPAQQSSLIDTTTSLSSKGSGKSSRPFYKTWWFWTGAAVIAIGGGVAAVFLTKRAGEPSLPESPYPVLDFSLQ